MLKYHITLLLMMFVMVEASASDAYVVAGNTTGQGVFQQRAEKCFFITTGQVVKNVTKTDLIMSQRVRYQAAVVSTSPDDVAILQVTLPKNTTCPVSRKSPDAKVSMQLSSKREGIIKTRLEDGSLLQTPVMITSAGDQHYAQIVAKYSADLMDNGFKSDSNTILGIVHRDENRDLWQFHIDLA